MSTQVITAVGRHCARESVVSRIYERAARSGRLRETPRNHRCIKLIGLAFTQRERFIEGIKRWVALTSHSASRILNYGCLCRAD
jgi:hypothetical protein